MSICIEEQSTDARSARERVELVLSRLDQLPTLPAVVNRLLAATTSEDSSVRDIVEIVESDASLTAMLLRMARRADLGVRADTVTVSRSVSLLGFTAVRNAVLAVKVFECFASPHGTPQTANECRSQWVHALAVACTADLLAQQVNQRERAGEAFVAGLLHDVGKMALYACMPKAYSRVMADAQEQGVCVCDAERKVFGIDHTIAGKHLGTRWDLPRALVECIWLHHQSWDSLPSSVVDPLLQRLVHTADGLVRLRGLGSSAYCSPEPGDQPEDDPLFTDEVVQHVMHDFPKRFDPIVEMFDLSGPGGEAVCSEALFEANRKLSQANARITEENRLLVSRVRVLEALHRFHGMLHGRESVSDVCAACVLCLRGLLSSDGMLLYLGDRRGRAVHAAVMQPQREEADRLYVEIGDLSEVTMVCRGAGAGFTPATELDAKVWTRCGVGDPTRPRWRLVIPCGPDAVVVLVVATDESQIATLGCSNADLDGLASAFGAAIVSSRSRVESERTTEEVVDLNRRLRGAQGELLRMKSLSMIAAMASGAAHEMNNPLSVISGRAQMELARRDDPQLRESLQSIVDQTNRATGIVNDLMAFAKPNPPKPVRLLLGELLEKRRQHCEAALGLIPDQLAVSVADPETTIYADPIHVRDILDALITNAVEAADMDSIQVKINSPSRRSDETVRIVVEDNGSGMSRDVLAHALDPFFSHRPAGRGRGLGLSRAQRLTEINNGRLRIDSAPGHGTKVTLEFPAHA